MSNTLPPLTPKLQRQAPIQILIKTEGCGLDVYPLSGDDFLRRVGGLISFDMDRGYIFKIYMSQLRIF